jgi:DNA-binding response OmpR family regulator
LEWPGHLLGEEAGFDVAAPAVFIIPRGVRLEWKRFALRRGWDFVSRPIAQGELAWRASMALRQIEANVGDPPVSPTKIECGPLQFEAGAQEVRLSGRVLNLRSTERAVLVYLMRNPTRSVPAAELQMIAMQSYGDGSAARNQIYELRRRLADAGYAKAILHHRGRGYQLSWGALRVATEL